MQGYAENVPLVSVSSRARYFAIKVSQDLNDNYYTKLLLSLIVKELQKPVSIRQSYGNSTLADFCFLTGPHFFVPPFIRPSVMAAVSCCFQTVRSAWFCCFVSFLSYTVLSKISTLITIDFGLN